MKISDPLKIAYCPAMEQPRETSQETKRLEKPRIGFGTIEEAEQYLEWKETVPSEVRRLVEGALLGNQIDPGQIGLPLRDRFLADFNESLREQRHVSRAETDGKVSNLLKPLEQVATKGGYLNAFETLANPSVSWSLKQTLYETQIRPALEWLVEQDLDSLAKQAEGRLRKSGA